MAALLGTGKNQAACDQTRGPGTLGLEDQATLSAAVGLFNAGEYLAAHELFEELWEATQGPNANFYKGCLQASIALYHFSEGNLAGASKLYGGHRRFLAAYMPFHLGYDIGALIADMQSFLQPVVRWGDREPSGGPLFEAAGRPRFKKSAK